MKTGGLWHAGYQVEAEGCQSAWESELQKGQILVAQSPTSSAGPTPPTPPALS